ncbi:MAG: GyrI-like domain-containing protein [Bacteroidota bacterium]|nr:GyrI-like domain-containing protein [Bacteroidota bacterium]
MITSPELIRTHRAITACIHLIIPARQMAEHMDPAIAEVLDTLKQEGKFPIGPLFSLHNRRPTETFDFDLGFPVAEPITPQGRVVNGELPAVQVVRTVYQGPYEHVKKAWEELREWVRREGHGESGRFWESYLTDPGKESDPTQWRTELNWVLA